MKISYRTRQLIRRILSAVVTVAAVILIAALCLVLWLQRFVVYTDDGAVLDFDRAGVQLQGQLPQAPELPSVTIHFRDEPFREGLQQLMGYYIDPSDLMDDPDAVRTRLESLPAGTPVLLDVKGYRGYFYYSTRVGATTSSSYDMAKMDDLIRWLASSDLYVIARMSALRDFDLVWQNNRCGLTKTSGVLYSDRSNYGIGYWLDPANADVEDYLIAVIRELDNLGFDEVVLQNFCFPDAENLAFQGDRDAAILALAQKLVTACGTDSFSVSFAGSDPGFALPEGLCRLYLEGISLENAQSAWDAVAMEDKRLYLVFVAPQEDARYQIENGMLLPLP